MLAWQKETGFDLAKVNVNGGAIALGHPLGATGARLMTTLLNELERTGGRYGLQTMCEGGGQANVTIIERLYPPRCVTPRIAVGHASWSFVEEVAGEGGFGGEGALGALTAEDRAERDEHHDAADDLRRRRAPGRRGSTRRRSTPPGWPASSST